MESGESNAVGASTRTHHDVENLYTQNNDSSNQPQQEALDTITDDLICPITLELPIEPVTAKDGQVYEKSAIETHFRLCREQNRPISSPTTNLPMQDELLPNPKTKSHIQKLVDLGLITGDLATNWNRRVKEQTEMKDLLRRAETGDAEAMYLVAQCYEQGTKGFPKSKTDVYTWLREASLSGSVKGQARMGYCLCIGFGVAQDETEGMRELALAACQGSRFAAFWIAVTYKNKRWGMPKDLAKAATFLRKALEPSLCNDLPDELEKPARDFLAELS